MRIWPALLLIAIAGCLGGDEPQDPAPSPVDDPPSLVELADIAEQAALAWNPEARLSTIAGFEQHNASSHDEDGEPWGFYEPVYGAGDDTLGDGVANAWLFVYNFDDVGLDIVVDSRGHAAQQEAESLPVLQDPNWTVTPGEAFAALQAAVPDILNASLPNAFVSYELTEYEGNTTWLVGALSGTADEKRFRGSHVHAMTGAVLTVGGVPLGQNETIPNTRGGTFEGDVRAPQVSEFENFQLFDDQRVLSFDVDVDTLVGDATVTLRWPDSSETDITDGGTFTDAPRGSYRIAVTLDGPDSASYTITWCAYSDNVGCQ